MLIPADTSSQLSPYFKRIYTYYTGPNMPENPLTITQLSASQLAQLLSGATRRKVTETEVLQIAETAGIIQPDNTINLIEYTAFLVSEVSNGSH